METIFTKYFIDSNYDKWADYKEVTGEQYYVPDVGTVERSDLFRHIYEQADYTVAEMEQALINASTLEEWYDNIKALYDENKTILQNIWELYPY